MKSTVLSFLMLLCISVHGQEWVDLMLDDQVNFYDVREAFNEEWQGKAEIRGRGYKQFKRWEYFMEPRVYPSGERVQGKALVEALKEVAKMPVQKSSSPWTPLGPTSWTGFGWNPGLGRVNAITVDPQDPERIFAATPSGGLWRSDDDGANWVCLTDTLVAIGASGIVVHPDDGDILYLATGDGNGADTYSFGVMKSIDGGMTWESTGLNFEVSELIRCTDMEMDPSDPDRIFVTTSEGLYVTADGGETWSQPVSNFLRDVEFHPSDPDIVYLSGTRFYRSEDGGSSFDLISQGLPLPSQVNRMEIAVTPADPELVYLVAGDSDDSGFHGFYRSTDQGSSFNLMSDSPNVLGYSETGDSEGGQSWYDLAIAASPTDPDQVFVGGINVWETLDGGNSWNIKSHWVYPSNIGYTHADIHSLDFYGDVLYCGSDGGVFRSENEGTTWTDLSEGLQISQFYRIAVSVQDPDLILAGSQDNGTNLFSEENGYVHLLGGDGNGAAIDYTNDDIMYAAYPGGSYQRSTNGGLSFQSLTGEIPETGAWVTPFEIHPDDPEILFAAYENVWKFENGNWSPISSLPITTTLRAMRVAPSDPEVIYTSTFSNLYRTTDGGDNWEFLSGGLPDLYITSIEVDPQNSERVWVSFSGYSDDEKIYKSENGGTSWENVTGNLPNVPINCLHYLNGSNDGIYAGSDIGVFYRDAELDNWSPFNQGLPNVIVNQLVFHYPSQRIILGSFGRGVWTNEFFDSENLTPVANFSSSESSICADGTVTFSNQSINATSGVEWTFEGGIPEISTESDPTVTYPSPGEFPVKLKVSNGDLADSLTVDAYVEVFSGMEAPFTEDFEEQTSDLEGWEITGPSNASGWTLNENIGFQSESSVFIENFQTPTNDQFRLITGLLDLTPLDTAILSMRVAYAEKPDSEYEALRVFMSSDCGESWTLKRVFTSSNALPSVEPTNSYFVPESSSEWNFLMVDNIDPDERTSQVRFRFAFYSNGGNNLYLDDINLSSEVNLSSINPAQLSGSINIYPNPSHGEVNLDLELRQSESVELILMDQVGRTVLRDGPLPLNAGLNQLKLSATGLAEGTYLLEVAGESGVLHRKIVLSR
jgi:PKD repeat protein